MMERNEKEYQSLLALRETLATKHSAQERKSATEKKLNAMKFDMTPPQQKKIVVSTHEDTIRKEFAAPTIKRARKDAYHRDRKLTATRNVFVVLASILLFAFALFLGYKLGVWGYNSFLSFTIDPDKNISISEAIGIYLFALTFVFAGLCIPFFYYAYQEDIGFLNIFGAAFSVAALISLIISFAKFYEKSEGFFETILFAFASILMIGYFLVALFKLIILVAVSGGLIFAGCRLLFWLREESSDINTYRAPVIDFKEIEKTEDYKQALALDRKATQDAIKRYKADYEKERELFLAQQGVYRDTVGKYNRIIAECDTKIKAATFLYESYRNLDMVGMLIYYLESQRAYDIVGAVNKYNDDLKAAKADKKLAEMEKLLRQQVEENQRLRKTVSKLRSELDVRMERMERSAEERAEQLQNKLDIMREERKEQTDRIASEIRDSAKSICTKLYYNLPF